MPDHGTENCARVVRDTVRVGEVRHIVRAKIAAIEELNEQLAEQDAGVILRQSGRLEEQIAAYRDLVEQHLYPRERAEPKRYHRHHEIIEDLFDLLTDQREALQKIALMVTPRKGRA